MVIPAIGLSCFPAGWGGVAILNLSLDLRSLLKTPDGFHATAIGIAGVLPYLVNMAGVLFLNPCGIGSSFGCGRLICADFAHVRGTAGILGRFLNPFQEVWLSQQSNGNPLPG